MRLEDQFDVPASPEAVWAFLDDVPRVVPCMPGAELLDVVGPDAWKAKMSVKLGPVALQFSTDVRREQQDEQDRSVTLAIVAREVRGRGSARATLASSIAEADGGARVSFVTDLNLQGPVAQYGRGIVADVAQQMTRQFATCMAAELTAQPVDEPGASPLAEAPPPVQGPSAQAPPPSPAPPQPAAVPGLRLVLRALWSSLRRAVRRRTGEAR